MKEKKLNKHYEKEFGELERAIPSEEEMQAELRRMDELIRKGEEYNQAIRDLTESMKELREGK